MDFNQLSPPAGSLFPTQAAALLNIRIPGFRTPAATAKTKLSVQTLSQDQERLPVNFKQIIQSDVAIVTGVDPGSDENLQQQLTQATENLPVFTGAVTLQRPAVASALPHPLSPPESDVPVTTVYAVTHNLNNDQTLFQAGMAHTDDVNSLRSLFNAGGFGVVARNLGFAELLGLRPNSNCINLGIFVSYDTCAEDTKPDPEKLFRDILQACQLKTVEDDGEEILEACRNFGEMARLSGSFYISEQGPVFVDSNRQVFLNPLGVGDMDPITTLGDPVPTVE